jgi:ribosomal protein S18 acetylase RimI-like enzyme
VRVRAGNTADLPFLCAMLVEAFSWNTDTRPYEVPVECSKLLDGWGRNGDHAVIAEIDGEPAGAAWFRLWTDDDHSYGFVADDVPEIALAVAPEFRRRGVARALLDALIQIGRDNGFRALSLSVDPRNPARLLYERAGFRKVGESGTSWTYLLSSAP